MHERDSLDNLIDRTSNFLFSVFEFFGFVISLTKVRELNWLMLLFFLPLCGLVTFDLTLGRPELMPWESWYGSLGIIETLRLYTATPFVLLTLYCLYRLFANEYEI